MRTPARGSRLVDGQDRGELIDDLVGGDRLDGVDLQQREIHWRFDPAQLALLDAFAP